VLTIWIENYQPISGWFTKKILLLTSLHILLAIATLALKFGIRTECMTAIKYAKVNLVIVPRVLDSPLLNTLPRITVLIITSFYSKK
jgi:hypothetical protein